MQFAKDSFFLALQERLAGLNPARTITLNGATVPAVVVAENLPPSSAEPLPNAFYIEWGAAEVVEGYAGQRSADEAGMSSISYYTLGSVQSMVDRGRDAGSTRWRTARHLPATEHREAGLHAGSERRSGNKGVLGAAVVHGRQRCGRSGGACRFRSERRAASR